MVAKHTYFEVLDVANFVVCKQVEREDKMLTDITAETGIGKRDVLLKTGIT